MKKALSFLSLIAGNIMIASAQVNYGGTVGGVPFSSNGGTLNVGVTASQGQVNGGALLGLINLAQTITSKLVPLAVGVAVLALFWFLIKFITKADDPAGKEAALKGMGYSILALFVMVSIWGIIGALGSMMGIGQGGAVPIPGIPVSN